jgi:phage gp37-like protein
MVKLAEIENAIIELVKTNLAYLAGNVQVATQENFDSEGNIIAIPPAVLVIYAGAEGSPADVRGLTYGAKFRWLVAAGASNLRGPLEAKQGDAAAGEKGAYDLLDDLRALGGTIISGNLLIWRGEELLQHSNEGTWYSVNFELEAAFVNVG